MASRNLAWKISSGWYLIFTLYSCILTTEALNPALMPLVWKRDRSLNHMVGISAVKIQSRSGISLLQCGRVCGGSAGCSSFSYDSATRRCFLKPVVQVGASATYLHFVKEGVTTAGQTTASTAQTTTTAAASNGPVANCATNANYTYMSDKLTCIKFIMFTETYASMKNECAADGARLMRVETASKLTDLVTILVQTYKQYNVYWLDATDTEVEGIFYWGGTSSTLFPNVVSSALFEFGEPNNGGGVENCLALSVNQKFTDRNCGDLLFGICELPAPTMA